MNAGLYAYWPNLEFKIDGNISVTRSGTGIGIQGSVELKSQFCEDYYTVSDGVYLLITAGYDSTSFAAFTNVYVEVPSLGISRLVTSASYSSTKNASLLFKDVYYYITSDALGLCWQMKCGDIEFYIDGVLNHTFAGPFSKKCYRITSDGIPLIGIPPFVFATPSNLSPLPSTPPSSGGSAASATSTITATGGWRFEAGGGWQTPPVSLTHVKAPLTVSCVIAAPTVGTVGGTNIFNCSATGGYSGSYSGGTPATFEENIYSSSVCALPNLPKSIKRWNSTNFALMVYRGGSPACKTERVAVCYDNTDSLYNSSSDTIEEIAATSEMLSVVTNSTHGIESQLGFTSFAPYSKNGARTWSKSTEFQWYTNLAAVSYPNVGTRTSQMISTWDHVEKLPRYLNYVVNPHGNYVEYTPPNADVTQWKVQGDKQFFETYWGQLRQQHLTHTNLPSIEKRQTRNMLLNSPWLRSYLGLWFNDYVFANGETWFWGLSRFEPVDPELSLDFTPDSTSSSAWSCTGGTPTYGTDIVISGAPTNIVLEYDIGSFTEPGRMLPHLAKAITVNWSNTNVTTCNVYLVNQVGDKVLLTSTQGTFDRTIYADTKYAGSYAQDFGLGVVTDVGSDSKASGISSTTLTDEETVSHFNLLAGFQAAKLRYEITATGGGDVTVNYPSFDCSEFGVILPETHNSYLLLYDNGPGVRIGTHVWYDGGLLTTPQIADVSYVSTAVDIMCTKRNLFMGVDRNDNLTTELNSFYTSDEQSSVADCDQHTIGWYAPVPSERVGYLYMHNTARGFPVCAQLPVFRRNANTKIETPALGLAQEAWSYVHENRYVVSAVKPVSFIDLNTSSNILVPSPTTLNGWSIQEHARKTDNNEDQTDFSICFDDDEIAVATPWHGYFIVANLSYPAEQPSNLHTQMGQFVRVYVYSGKVYCKFSDFSSPRPWARTSEVSSTGTHPCVAEGTDSRLIVCYTDSSTLKLRQSWDDGGTWSTATNMITSCAFGRIASNRRGSVCLMGFKFDSGTSGPGKIYYRFQGPGDTSYSAEATIKDSTGTALSFDSEFFDISAADDNADRWLLTCLINGETELTEWQSFDNCATWSKVG